MTENRESSLSAGTCIREGQVLSGPLFSEPMRVETVRPNGPGVWVAGVVGQRSEQFRLVTLTSDDISNLEAATALEESGFFIRKIGTDGYRIHHQATLKKVVSDRLASLDEKTEIRPAIRKLVYRHGGDMRYLTACKDDFSDVRLIPNLNIIDRSFRLATRLLSDWHAGATDHRIDTYCGKLKAHAIHRLKS